MSSEDDFAQLVQSNLDIGLNRMIKIIRKEFIRLKDDLRKSSDKICPRCGKEKSRDQFRRDTHKSSGIRSECKQCAYLDTKARNDRNKEKNKNDLVELPDYKKCSMCKNVKSSDQFHLSASSDDGLQYYCIPCRRSYEKAYRSLRRVRRV